MSIPVFMGHAHKFYGWNECCASLKNLFIHAYLYLWLKKKKNLNTLRNYVLDGSYRKSH